MGDEKKTEDKVIAEENFEEKMQERIKEWEDAKAKNKNGGCTAVTKSKITKKSKYNKDDEWESGLKYVDGCPLIKDVDDPDPVFIKRDALTKIWFAFDHFDSEGVEFGAYLLKDPESDDDTIVDIYLPEQEVSSVTFEFINEASIANVVGIIHSHPSGVKNFSSVDEEYCNANNNISLLVESSGITATRRVQLGCGSFSRIEVDFQILYPEEFHEWLEDSKTRVEKETTIMGYNSRCKSFYGTYTKCPKCKKWHYDDEPCDWKSKASPKEEIYGNDEDLWQQGGCW